MNGTRVPTRASSGNCAMPSAWATNTAATITRAPSRAEIGTNSTRPASCIAPVQPITAAAVAGAYPRSTRNGIRCVVTAAVAKLDTRNAIESTQKTAVRAAWPSDRLAATPRPRRQRRARPRRTERAADGDAGERGHAEADGEGRGHRHAGGAEVLLHRPQEDGEPVVDDSPGDRFRHRQRGDDHPAVIDGARAKSDVRVISPRCARPPGRR